MDFSYYQMVSIELNQDKIRVMELYHFTVLEGAIARCGIKQKSRTCERSAGPRSIRANVSLNFPGNQITRIYQKDQQQ